MSRLPFVTLALLAAVGSSTAHEIKVLVSQQSLPAAGKTTVYLSWGHRLPVDDVIDAATLERYELLPPSGEAVRLKAEGVSLQANPVPLKADGAYQAVVVRKPSVLTYVLDKEGERVMKRGGKSSVTEGTIDTAFRSVQTGKAVVVVGKAGDKPLAPAGLPVEIVPLDSPATWHADTDLKFRVFVGGKPVTSKVVIEARPVSGSADDEGVTSEAGADGVATFRPNATGVWVIKANVKVPAAAADRTEFDEESYTTTLTFEVTK